MSQEHLPSEAPEEAVAPEEQPAVADAADVEALHAEVADLRRQVAESEAEKEPSKHTGRRWVVGLLIVLGCLLLAAGSVALWVRDVVLDTGTWVATFGPITQNEVVANTLSVYVVNELFDLVDVEGVAREALPEELAALSSPLVGALRDLASDATTELVKSDQFNTVWVAANTAAHKIAMGALRGGSSHAYWEDGKLTLDLSDELGSLERALGLQDLGLFAGQETPGKIVLFESEQFRVIQNALNMIDRLGIVLPLLALLSYLVAWVLSLWRRRTVMWIGIGVAITMTLSLFAIALAQPLLLGAILDPFYRLLADEILGVVLSGLIWQTVLLGILGLLLALGAWVAGPSDRAVGIRTEVGGWFGKSAA